MFTYNEFQTLYEQGFDAVWTAIEQTYISCQNQITTLENRVRELEGEPCQVPSRGDLQNMYEQGSEVVWEYLKHLQNASQGKVKALEARIKELEERLKPPLDCGLTEAHIILMKGALATRRLVPFLGAGASIPAGYPGGYALAEAIIQQFAIAPEFAYDKSMNRDDLLMTTAEYYNINLPGDVPIWLNDHLGTNGRQPLSIHHYLAEQNIPLILTTNYDTLIEDALKHTGKDFAVFHYLIMDESGTNLWYMERYEGENKINCEQIDKDRFGTIIQKTLDKEPDEPKTLVIKIHGSVHPKERSFVISIQQYEEFLYRMMRQLVIPPSLADYLGNAKLLFLGYGLGDWNLRLLLTLLYKKRGESQRWAIQRAQDVTKVDRDIWKKRNVEIIGIDLQDFVERMKV